MRYFLEICYKGSNYKGWQKQKNTNGCIQQIIEQALASVIKENINLIGCGRTDAGVHANQFFAHFDTELQINMDFIPHLNFTLPVDIAALRIVKVEEYRHARFDAKQRSYIYKAHFIKEPFISELSAYYDFDLKALNVNAMKTAANNLCGNFDFYSFCKTPERHESTMCNVSKFEIELSGNHMEFNITSNRFLKSMVRIIVFELFEIGLGKKTIDEVGELLHKKRKEQITKIAHPQGLYLDKVVYDFLD